MYHKEICVSDARGHIDEVEAGRREGEEEDEGEQGAIGDPHHPLEHRHLPLPGRQLGLRSQAGLGGTIQALSLRERARNPEAATGAARGGPGGERGPRGGDFGWCNSLPKYPLREQGFSSVPDERNLPSRTSHRDMLSGCAVDRCVSLVTGRAFPSEDHTLPTGKGDAGLLFKNRIPYRVSHEVSSSLKDASGAQLICKAKIHEILRGPEMLTKPFQVQIIN